MGAHAPQAPRATSRPGAASLSATAPGAQFIHHRGRTGKGAR
ncbi:DUF6380 family protein [Streptomyces acidiscabies]